VQIGHRAADWCAVHTGSGIAHAQYIFTVGEHHAEKGRHPHPEDRARAANPQGCRHTYDISRSHCRSQRRRKGLELCQRLLSDRGFVLPEAAECTG